MSEIRRYGYGKGCTLRKGCSAILLFDKGFSIKKTHSATKYAYEKNAPKGTIQINNKVEGISC